MAETRTVRLNLPQWSDGATDTMQRTDLNEAFADLEGRVPRYLQGTLAARPAAGPEYAGTFYWVQGDGTALNNGVLWYCNGSTWARIGSNLTTVTIRSGATGEIPLIIQAVAGQTADLQRWMDSTGSFVAYISKNGTAQFNGGVATAGPTQGQSATYTTLTLSGALFGTTASLSNYVKAPEIRGNATRADGQYKNQILDTGTTRLDGLIPPGTIVMSAASVEPAGWLFCRGQVVLRADYLDLFNAIGTEFNTGGETASQFRLPNFSFRVPIGTDLGRAAGAGGEVGDVVGSENITMTQAQMPSHWHDGTADGGGHEHTLKMGNSDGTSQNVIRKASSTQDSLSEGPFTWGLVNTEWGTHEHTFSTEVAGGGQPINITQASLTVNFLIRT